MTMDDIAVVGFSFKMPQTAKDEASFWELLQERRNVMTEWPESRLRLDTLYGAKSNEQNKVCLFHQ